MFAFNFIHFALLYIQNSILACLHFARRIFYIKIIMKIKVKKSKEKFDENFFNSRKNITEKNYLPIFMKVDGKQIDSTVK
jgi:hypothetical protein